MKYFSELSHSRIALATFMVTGMLIGADHVTIAMLVMLFGALLDGFVQYKYDL